MGIDHCEGCYEDKDDDHSPNRETRMPGEAAYVPTCYECPEDMTPEP